MNTVFKKLNFKDQKVVHIINAPDSFKPEMREISLQTEVVVNISTEQEINFFLAFVSKQKEVDELASLIEPRLATGAVLWFAYPKGSSKRYRCEFNRDTGWAVLGQLGFEGVRMVAIDEDWSALRFKRVEAIRKMTRRFAMTETGQKKSGVQKSWTDGTNFYF